MKGKRTDLFRELIAAVAAGLILSHPALARGTEEEGKVERKAEIKQVELRGKVVCLPELMHALYGAELPSEHEHVYGFQTSDGTIYYLLRTKYSDALFIDQRLREKELLLKGRLFPKSHVFEPTRMRSIRNGEVNDLYYWCSVCSIESISAGPCACCQGPVELIEKPLRERGGR